MENILQRIIEFTDRAHGGQQRKYTPDRYIVHPVRVMRICQEHSSHLPLLAAALLHDVLEDTPTTKEEITQFLLTLLDVQQVREAVGLVVELTDVYIKKDFPQWNRRHRKQLEVARMVKTSPAAQTIKYADIIDNCHEIVQHDRDFARVFLSECKSLLKHLNNGNPQLHKQATELVKSWSTKS
jgi:guanosine-3',5'-bis(diphosphate) 3'-pyrophosphohydrolase